MNYIVTINQFEGPLDLLLHLIKEAQIDIYDISIEDITKQYLDYIRAMEQLNLSIASEYLVMAADLIEMKSRSLLPNKNEATEDEYEEDPREALIKKLLAYKKYKEVSSEFKKLEENRQQIYTKLSSLNQYIKGNVLPTNEMGISVLLEAFERFLERQRLAKPLKTKITKKEISIDDRCRHIKKILMLKKEVPFSSLFDIISKDYVIVTFLAILEMAQKRELIIIQHKHFDDIILKLRGSE